MLKTLAVSLLMFVSVPLALAYRCCKHADAPRFLRSPRRTQQLAPARQPLGARVWSVVSPLKPSAIFSIAAPPRPRSLFIPSLPPKVWRCWRFKAVGGAMESSSTKDQQKEATKYDDVPLRVGTIAGLLCVLVFKKKPAWSSWPVHDSMCWLKRTVNCQ